ETRQAFSELRTEVREGFASLGRRFDGLEKRVDDLERQVAHQRVELVNAMKLFGVIGETINDIHHHVSDLQRTVQDLAERIGRLNTESIRMRTADIERYAALDARMINVERELAELRAKIEAFVR